MKILPLLLFLSLACQKSATPPAQKPVELISPDASREARAVFAFLQDMYGKKTLSGVMTLNSFDEVVRVKALSGREPAIVGMDFMHHHRGYMAWFNEEQIVDDAKAHWAKNGIPALMWHWRDPSRKTEAFYTKDTDFDLSKIQNPTSAEYNALVQDIDYIAVFLKKLEEAKVPVLWRPLHEASGTWFWWGAKGPENYKMLWTLLFERLVHHHKLKNLIWIWTADSSDVHWFPGKDKVDIIGVDLYGDSRAFSPMHKLVQSLYPDRLIALSECGTLPEVQKDGIKFSWFMVWYGDFVVQNSDQWKVLLQNPDVITLDQMPKL
jgi:mannan endo-1,4-beta-mannosidase